MHITLVKIPAEDMISLHLVDRYRMHQYLYQAHFPHQASRDFLFKVKTMDRINGLTLLVVSADAPVSGPHLQRTKEVPEDFFGFGKYRVHAQLNPTRKCSGKILGITDAKEIGAWFSGKAAQAGCSVASDSLEVHEVRKTHFMKDGKKCTVINATVSAVLEVADASKWRAALSQGLGRGKAFGFGLLEAQPVA